MVGNTVAPPAASSRNAEATFPSMYYDSPVEQMVLGFDVPSDDSLTASITLGSPYFTVSKVDVCDWIVDIQLPPDPGELPVKSPGSAGHPELPPLPVKPPGKPTQRKLSAPVATSDGVTPLSVKLGQYARFWVNANVPKGALPPGAFTGTAVLTGKNIKYTIALKGTYLGNLLGNVLVQPSTVAPGQSVLVQVLDASGKPYTDSSVIVTIQAVQTTARYYQFPNAGDYKLIVRAARGPLSESTTVTVAVAGAPLAFRRTLMEPALRAMPILQAKSDLGRPYVANFTLGTPRALLPVLARKIAAAAPPATSAAAPPAPATSVSNAPLDALGDEFSKAIAALPSDQVIRIAPQSTTSGGATAPTSAVFAPVTLRTPPIATSYKWDFGDGQVVTTQSPSVTHDYFPAIQAGKIAHSFDVTCTVVHDNLTVKRTLVLHSAYGLCRQLGIVVPPVTGDVYATFQHVAFTGSMVVHNLESSQITLNRMACLALSDDASAELPSPQFTAMQVPIVLAANSATALGVYIPLSELQKSGGLGPSTNGFTVYYLGAVESANGTQIPVRFSYTFKISLSDSGAASFSLPANWAPSAWDLGSALNAVSAVALDPKLAVSKSGGQVLDPATKTVAIALSASAQDVATLAQVRSAIQAGATSIAVKLGALTPQAVPVRLNPAAGANPRSAPQPLDTPYNPWAPPPVAEGAVCYPDDISDADAATAYNQQLVCQLTGETQSQLMPAQFQNAFQGDIVLSPAPVDGGDLISAMFRALTPPQHHGHSGIMTQNFIEITHCTASPDRIKSNLNTESLGPKKIPTSLNSGYLQYAWPGSLTQSIDDVTTSLALNDPSGQSYSLKSFDPDTQGDGMEIIPPVVVKPLPDNEGMARPALRKIADTARSKGARYDENGNLTQKGGCYYSFYGYTKPEIAAGFTDQAGADAGWAEGMSPAVCASFVWLCMKENNLPLVTSNKYEKLSDFSQEAVAGGVEVGPATLDGLFYYPQSERQQAAQALYQMFMNQALTPEGGLGTIPGVNDILAGPIADQLLNMFAFGNPNMVGSSAWQNPGDGNAVSPDNMIWWNPPYFGYNETLQFLPQHTEQYTVSRWKKVITRGSIRGTVRANGAPVPNAQVWVYNPGGTTMTAADGSYALQNVPIGSYNLKASAVIGNAEYSQSQPVTLTTADPNQVQDIELQPPAQCFRRLDITCSVSCDHGDDNPGDTTGWETQGPDYHSLYVNPGRFTDSLKWSFDYAGGGYFHIDYTFDILLLATNAIALTIAAAMYDDGSNDQQTHYVTNSIIINPGGTISGYINNLEHAPFGYHNGPANFTFTVTNAQQTG